MSWRVANSLLRLRRDLDRRWPNRDRRTDGFIGDEAHCGGPNPTSNHCPNSADVVRAFDIDVDGIPSAWLAEHVRKLGKRGDGRLANGGYVIYNRRIASSTQDWRWRHYTGDNPHTDHIHVSVSENSSGYDKENGWGVLKAQNIPVTSGRSAGLPHHKLGSRRLQLKQPHMRGTDVAFVQRFTGAEDDGNFGENTRDRVKRFQGIVGLPQSGIVERHTWEKMRVF
jgi:hypothetical protein